jgi:hypothetical protein
MPINLTSNATNYAIRILKSKTFQTKSSKLSAMMPGLINSMNPEEVLDPLAFLRSGVEIVLS